MVNFMKKGIITRIKNSSFEGNNYVGNFSHVQNCEIGKMTYLGSNCKILYAKIGKFCSFANGVKIIFGAHPTNTWISTHPAFYSRSNCCGVSYSSKNLFEEYKYIDESKKYMVAVGNDVWVGTDAKITGGVTVGDGAIILAGAVVTKDVAPYSIVGGVPAKQVGTRFEAEDIEFLLNLKWWDKSPEWLAENAKHFNNIDYLKGATDL